MIRWMVAALVAFAIVPKAHAYDEDMHFYGTYAMARFAGIKHQVALKMALSAVWMDESYISDPMSMIFLPITGVKKRRLLHFPSARENGELSADAQKKIFAIPVSNLVTAIANKLVAGTEFAQSIDSLTLVSNTEENSEWASELLMRGLKAGDLMMASGSLHVIEDSYAHAGTPAGEGHFYSWHWPDRPFNDPAKYHQMVQTVFYAIVAIRGQLPDSAIDKSLYLHSGPGTGLDANYKMSPDALAEQYWGMIKDTISYNMLLDPTYVRAALEDYYRRAVTRTKYINAKNLTPAMLDAAIKALPLGTIDAYRALEMLLTKVVDAQQATNTQYLDFNAILDDMGLWNNQGSITLQQYIASQGHDMDPNNPVIDTKSQSFKNFVHKLAYRSLLFQVPIPPSTTHRRELEDDTSIVRATEMKLRIANMRQRIQDLFGIDVELVPNNTASAEGFAKEIEMDSSAEPVLPAQRTPGTVYASFNGKEKYRWDLMIFHYLFPDLTAAELKSLIDVQIQIDREEAERKEYVKKRKAINSDPKLNVVEKKAKLLRLDGDYPTVNIINYAGTIAFLTGRVALTAAPLKQRFFDDLANGIWPGEDNMFFQNPYELADYRARGVIKKFLSPTDAWQGPTMQTATLQLR